MASASAYDSPPTRSSLLGSAMRLGIGVGTAVMRPPAQFAGRSLLRGTRAAVDAAIDSGLIDDALASPLFERLTQRALESPSMEQLVVRVIDSRLVDAAVAQLLESDDLWLVVDEIAQSPSVTAAISQQGLGFASQVSEAVRARSIRADDRIERAARRLLGRRPAPPAEP